MEKEIFIHQESEEDHENKVEKNESAHKEVVKFFEKHRDFLEHYARGQIKERLRIAENRRFAIFLKNIKIFLQPTPGIQAFAWKKVRRAWIPLRLIWKKEFCTATRNILRKKDIRKARRFSLFFTSLSILGNCGN